MVTDRHRWVGEDGGEVGPLDGRLRCRRTDTGQGTDGGGQVDMGPERRGDSTGGGNPGHLHIERHPHDLVVDERAFGSQPVRPAHVPMVGGEDDDGVVPCPRLLQRTEDGAQVAIGHLVEMDVVVEMTQPRLLVVRVDVAPQPVLLVPTPLAVRLGLGVQVVIEVGRQIVDNLVVGLGEDRERIVVLPRRRLENRAHAGHVGGMALPVAGLVDGEPHHIVRVDQRHGQEPRLGGSLIRLVGPRSRAGVGFQPVGGVGGDDRVEMHPGARPPHEVAVVAVPVGKAVGLHVGGGRLREVPLADVGRAVAGAIEEGAEGGHRSGQLLVLRHDDVVIDAVAGQVPPGEQAGPAG